MKLPMYFKYYVDAVRKQEARPSRALHVYEYKRGGGQHFYVLHHTSYGIPYGCTDAQPGCP